jgi:hypothetical protein
MLAGVIVIGAALGVAIAGWPDSNDEPTIRPAAPVAAPLDTTPFPSVTSAGAGATVLPASSTASTPASETTALKVASLPATPSTVSVTTAVPTTAAPVVTVPVTTGTTTGSTAAPTVPPATVLPPGLTALARDQVRVVLANGDGRYNLVGRNVDRLLPLGYVTIEQTDLAGRVDRTVVYYRDGFMVEAVRLAADLLVPDALVEPLGTRTITSSDGLGDLVAVLGPDAVR